MSTPRRNQCLCEPAQKWKPINCTKAEKKTIERCKDPDAQDHLTEGNSSSRFHVSFNTLSYSPFETNIVRIPATQTIFAQLTGVAWNDVIDSQDGSSIHFFV